MTRLRAFTAQMDQGPMPWLLILAVVGFAVHLLQQQGVGLSAICGQVSLAYLLDPDALRMLILSPWNLVTEWAIMILFMMPPLLSQQVSHLLRSNLPDRRAPGLVLFAFAYAMCWLITGMVLVPVGIVISALSGQFFDTGFILVLALVWSASPWAQSARNRCHQMRRISPFGAQANMDNMRQGLDTGVNCVMACWPWMILPMTVETGHSVMMVLVAVYLFAERLAPAGTVRWRISPGLVTLGMARKLSAPPGISDANSKFRTCVIVK